MITTFWQWLQQIDHQIMSFIHQRLAKPRLTSIMEFFSHPPYWRQIILVLILFLLILGQPPRWQILILLLAITLSDQTCNLLKALVKRVRPDGDRPTEGGFWQKLGHYSFPSSHAADNFCAAVLTFHWWPGVGIFFFALASIVTFSRVYLQNHYPSDVIGGGLIGIGYGILFIKLIS